MAYLKTDLISIDAWRYGSNWEWNNWFTVEEGIYWNEESPMNARRILKALREMGFLTDSSKGKLTVEDDGYNYVIAVRGTDEPIFALCYGRYL